VATLGVVALIAWRVPALRALDAMPTHPVGHVPPPARAI